MSLFLSAYVLNWRNSKVPKNILGKIRFLHKKHVPTSNRLLSQKVTTNEEKHDKFVPFLDIIKFRREEAGRSILVQVQSAQSYKELHSYCSSVGTVKNMFHYTTGVEPLHFIMVEFASDKDVVNVLSESSHVEDGVPTNSQYLWFRASSRKLSKLKQSKNCKLEVENGTTIVEDSDIRDSLKECENISKQITLLHNTTKLNDLGSRLRFLTARQIEVALSGMFPQAISYPFGSSVNGFGKMGCDLDLVLRLTDQKANDHSRLMFHCKAAPGTERTSSQRYMETLGDLIHLFFPGCSQVRRILQARVPIIKFHQQLTDVECDLSMANMSGVYMSDFLYIMGSFDERVRPLTFAIRKWASEVGLTNSSPGRWITNFSLTLLVLAYLQKPLNGVAIIPSLNTLTKLAGPNDKYIEDGIDCTFLRDISKIKKSENFDTLETLLHGFFEHYSNFDFTTKAVCLNEPVALTKPEHSPMYIVNPIERGLNVSKNVSVDEVERFKMAVRNAVWSLESQETAGHLGLLSILDNKKSMYNINFALSAKQRRLMEVSTLFHEETEKIPIQNSELKQQIDNIKRDTQEKIKVLENANKRQWQR